MKKLAILVALLFTFTASAVVTPTIYAATDPFEQACNVDREGSATPDACEPDGTDPIGGPNGILMTVTNTIALLAGVTSVIIIIIAGFQFVFSGGDAQKVASARSAIIYALAGLIFIVVARSIIAVVVTQLAK